MNVKQDCQPLKLGLPFRVISEGKLGGSDDVTKRTYRSLRRFRYGCSAAAFRTSIPASATVLQHDSKGHRLQCTAITGSVSRKDEAMYLYGRDYSEYPVVIYLQFDQRLHNYIKYNNYK